jgi:hypothetical protein
VRTFGRFLQAVGLVLLPYALWYGLTHEGPGVIGREVVILGAGAALFLLGRWLEGSGGA